MSFQQKPSCSLRLSVASSWLCGGAVWAEKRVDWRRSGRLLRVGHRGDTAREGGNSNPRGGHVTFFERRNPTSEHRKGPPRSPGPVVSTAGCPLGSAGQCETFDGRVPAPESPIRWVRGAARSSGDCDGAAGLESIVLTWSSSDAQVQPGVVQGHAHY